MRFANASTAEMYFWCFLMRPTSVADVRRSELGDVLAVPPVISVCVDGTAQKCATIRSAASDPSGDSSPFPCVPRASFAPSDK